MAFPRFLLVHIYQQDVYLWDHILPLWPPIVVNYIIKIVLFLLFWSDDDTVNHNCILVIKISPSRWPEHQLKHVGETIVNNIHHRILKCSLLVILVYIFWISIQCCHCDHTALHVTGPSDVGSCNNRFWTVIILCHVVFEHLVFWV